MSASASSSSSSSTATTSAQSNNNNTGSSHDAGLARIRGSLPIGSTTRSSATLGTFRFVETTFAPAGVAYRQLVFDGTNLYCVYKDATGAEKVHQYDLSEKGVTDTPDFNELTAAAMRYDREQREKKAATNDRRKYNNKRKCPDS